MNIFNWIKTNKTTLIGLFTLIYGGISNLLIQKGVITMETFGTITAVLTGFGLLAAKDASKHSTITQINKASIQAGITPGATEPVSYDQYTESDRLALNTAAKGTGYVCYQINQGSFPIGYYQINTSLTWDYIGTRPPHR